MSHDDLRDDGADLPPVRAYRPGSWFGVLGERTSVLLPPSQRPRVAGLWELVDAGADFAEVLDALVAGGLRELPAFVLWGRTPDGLRVLLRGDARVSALADGGPVRIEGSGAATWVERTLPAGTTLTVVLEEHDAGADLLVDAGLVRLGSLRDPAESESEPGPAAPPVAALDVEAPAAEAAVLPVPEDAAEDDADDTGDAIGGHPVPEAPPEPDVWPADDSLLTEPIQTLPPEVAREVVGPPEPPPFAPSFAQPVAQWAPVPFPGPQAPAPDDASGPLSGDADHDGMTRAGSWEPDQFVRHHPGIPGQPPAPSVVSRPVARLVISSGDTVEVDRVILVGRAPEARRFTSTEQPRLVTVPSPQKEISSTHLEIRPGSGADHGTAVVTDMGSTNGTVLVQPGLPPEDLRPGVAVQLIPGAVLDLGDSVTIQVTGP